MVGTVPCFSMLLSSDAFNLGCAPLTLRTVWVFDLKGKATQPSKPCEDRSWGHLRGHCNAYNWWRFVLRSSREESCWRGLPPRVDVGPRAAVSEFFWSAGLSGRSVLMEKYFFMFYFGAVQKFLYEAFVKGLEMLTLNNLLWCFLCVTSWPLTELGAVWSWGCIY